MAGFRKLLCESDRQCECAVPLLGDAGEIDLVWCLDTCDSECGEYRETAITKMSALSHILFITNAIVGLVLAALLMLALFLLERIISAPIVKSSKESNIVSERMFLILSNFSTFVFPRYDPFNQLINFIIYPFNLSLILAIMAHLSHNLLLSRRILLHVTFDFKWRAGRRTSEQTGVK